MVYVTRNLKDVLVSYYHHYSMLFSFSGSLNDFFDAFIADVTVYSPYFSHVREFYEQLKDDNILFIKFEDMKKNLAAVIKQVADFLNKTFSDEELKKLEDHLTFASMRGY